MLGLPGTRRFASSMIQSSSSIHGT
jgi:hypothetical protein